MQVRGKNPAENCKTTTAKVKILTCTRCREPTCSCAATATISRHRTETSAWTKAISAPIIASTRNVTIYNVINISFTKKTNDDWGQIDRVTILANPTLPLTLDTDLDPWPRLSVSGKLWPWPIHMLSRSNKVSWFRSWSSWKQTDTRTDTVSYCLPR